MPRIEAQLQIMQLTNKNVALQKVFNVGCEITTFMFNHRETWHNELPSFCLTLIYNKVKWVQEHIENYKNGYYIYYNNTEWIISDNPILSSIYANKRVSNITDIDNTVKAFKKIAEELSEYYIENYNNKVA